MSTYINDLKNNCLIYQGLQATAATTGNTAATSLDMIRADNNCWAIQSIGTVVGNTPILTGKIQESTDGTTWTDVVTGGVTASFAAATTNGQIETINFDRTARYLRHYSTTTGTGSLAIPITVIVGETLKQY